MLATRGIPRACERFKASTRLSTGSLNLVSPQRRKPDSRGHGEYRAMKQLARCLTKWFSITAIFIDLPAA